MGEIIPDKMELQKRVYKVSLLLRRQPINIVVQAIMQTYGVCKGTAYNYIRMAREDWQKYFDHLKYSGMGYYVSQLRELKDQAYKSCRVIKKGDEEIVVKTPNLSLVFEITKEEAKLMGQYPAEKHEVDIISSFAGWIKKVKEKNAIDASKSKQITAVDAEVLEELEEDSNGNQPTDGIDEEDFKM